MNNWIIGIIALIVAVGLFAGLWLEALGLGFVAVVGLLAAWLLPREEPEPEIETELKALRASEAARTSEPETRGWSENTILRDQRDKAEKNLQAEREANQRELEELRQSAEKDLDDLEIKVIALEAERDVARISADTAEVKLQGIESKLAEAQAQASGAADALVNYRERDALLIRLCGELGLDSEAGELLDRAKGILLERDLARSDALAKQTTLDSLSRDLTRATIETAEAKRLLESVVGDPAAVAERDRVEAEAAHEAEVIQFYERIAKLEVDIEEAYRERDEANGYWVEVSRELSEELDRSSELRVEVGSLRDQLAEKGVSLPPRAPSLARVSITPAFDDEVEESQVEQEDTPTDLMPRPEDIPSPPPFGTDAEGEAELVRPVEEAGPDEVTKTAKNQAVDADE